MSLTNFQKMLSKIAETGEKAIISSKEENKLTAEKTDLKKKLSNTYSSLPSDIDCEFAMRDNLIILITLFKISLCYKS